MCGRVWTVDEQLDETLAQVREALAEGEPEEALDLLDAGAAPLGGIEAELLRARAHMLMADDFGEALDALRRAGEAGAEADTIRALYEPLLNVRLPYAEHAALLEWLVPLQDDPDLAIYLARLHLRAEEIAAAETAARRALDIAPGYAAGLRTMFVVMMSSDEPGRAADVVREALRVRSTDPRFPALKALLSGMEREDAELLVAEMAARWPGRRAAALLGRPQGGQPVRPEANGAYHAAIQGDLQDALARAEAHLETRRGKVLTEQETRIREVLPLIPGPDTRDRPLIVDDGAEVLRSGPSRSGVTVLVFSNLAHQTIYQAEVIDAFAAAAGAATMVLRDYSYRLFIGGVGSLASDRAGTLKALERELIAMGTEQLIVLGVSSGGFSGASYACELGAERVIGLSISSNIDRFLRGDDRRARMLIQKLARSFPPEELDLTLKLPHLPYRTPIELYYGEGNLVDRAHSEDMAGMEGVTLRPVPGLERHQVLPSMILDGSFQAWLEDPARDDL
jgi:hypothetical protein